MRVRSQEARRKDGWGQKGPCLFRELILFLKSLQL